MSRIDKAKGKGEIDKGKIDKGKGKGEIDNQDQDKMAEKQVSITRKALQSYVQGRITNHQLSEMLLVARHLAFEAGSAEELQFVKDYEEDKEKSKIHKVKGKGVGKIDKGGKGGKGNGKILREGHWCE
jgi:hypothetical protein